MRVHDLDSVDSIVSGSIKWCVDLKYKCLNNERLHNLGRKCSNLKISNPIKLL